MATLEVIVLEKPLNKDVSLQPLLQLPRLRYLRAPFSDKDTCVTAAAAARGITLRRSTGGL